MAVLSMGLTFDVVVPNAYSLSYNEQVSNQKNNMWQLGKNLEIGDSFTYKICDPNSVQNYSAESYHYFTKNLEHNSSLCYTLHLHFINHVISDENQINGNTWIVEAGIIDYFSGDIRKSIFHIDANSWNVKSADTIHPDTARFADSLENTLFSIYKYTAQESKLLQEGVKWGEVTEYRDLMQTNPDMTVLNDGIKFEATEFVQKSFLSVNNSLEPIPRTLDVSQVGYDIDIIDDDAGEGKKDNDVTNYYLVNNDLPFPVEATYYSPSHIMEPFKQYEFELISFFDASNTLEINSSNADVAVESDDNDDTNDIHVESGTIELTFPDNVIDSTEDNDNDDKTIESNNTDKNNDDSIDNTQDQNENNDDDTANTINIIDDKTDTKEIAPLKSSLMIILSLVIGIVVTAIFVYFKKFRKTNSAIYGVFGKDDDNDNDINLQTHEKKITVSFDDFITINITSISD